MPSHHQSIPPAPQPTKIVIDPFNSSATGHQQAENRLSGSVSWRDSRTFKLAHQFKDRSGRGGSQHLSEFVVVDGGHCGKDGRNDHGSWEKLASALREDGGQDIRDLMSGTRKRMREGLSSDDVKGASKKTKRHGVPDDLVPVEKAVRETVVSGEEGSKIPPDMSRQASKMSSTTMDERPQIFRSLVLYLNGSTAPLVSDHKLKQLWVQHGGSVSIGLGRKTVTHVILGDGCGGGLASGKIQKEVARLRGKGVKYVSVKWVLDCVEKGKRVSEAGYGVVEHRIGGAGQRSVWTMFSKDA